MPAAPPRVRAPARPARTAPAASTAMRAAVAASASRTTAIPEVPSCEGTLPMPTKLPSLVSYRISKDGLVKLLAECLVTHGSMSQIQAHISAAGRTPGVDATVSPEFIATHELSRYSDRDDIIAAASALAATIRQQQHTHRESATSDQQVTSNALRWPFVAAAILSFVAIADLPYAYYQLLRWIVCVAAVVAAMRAHAAGRIIAPWALALIALVFNPLIRFHFSKETWAAWNVAAGITLLVASSLEGSRRPRGRRPDGGE